MILTCVYVLYSYRNNVVHQLFLCPLFRPHSLIHLQKYLYFCSTFLVSSNLLQQKSIQQKDLLMNNRIELIPSTLIPTPPIPSPILTKEKDLCVSLLFHWSSNIICPRAYILLQIADIHKDFCYFSLFPIEI